VRAETVTRHLEIVRRSLEALETADLAAFRRLAEESTHPEVEWRPLIGTGIEGTYRGRDRIVSFFADFVGSFEVRYLDPELRAIGDDSVLLLGRMRLKGRHSGAQVERELAAVYEFEDGLLRRGRAYPTHEEALAAAEKLVDAGA
jgi:ketosteroid isomerase-like protein